VNVPIYHIAGINTAIIALHMAEKLVYLAQFEPSLFLDTIEKEAIGYVYVVPAMLQTILDYPDFSRRNLSSLKLVGYGASPMPLDLLLRAKRELPTDYANSSAWIRTVISTSRWRRWPSSAFPMPTGEKSSRPLSS